MSFYEISVDKLAPGMKAANVSGQTLPAGIKPLIPLSSDDISAIRQMGRKDIFVQKRESGPKTAKVGSFVDKVEYLGEPGFQVDIKNFVVGGDLPVDVYWGENGEKQTLIIKKGINLTDTVAEVIRGSEIRQVTIPESQRLLYATYRDIFADGPGSEKARIYDGKYTDPAKRAEQHRFLKEYEAINCNALVPGVKIPFPLFIKVNDEIRSALEKDKALEEEFKKAWIEKNANLLIKSSDHELYKAYLHSASKESKDPHVRAGFVRENSMMIVGDLAADPRSEKIMAETKESVTDLTQSIMENPNTFYGLMKINNHDYYTFTHSVNVSTMSLALAMAHGITDKADLADIGLGSIMHDLGKAKVGSDIINKPGKLSDSEFRAMQNHVTLGYEMLKGNKDIPERAFYPLLQHHEKLSGRGYPNKLQPDQIHLFGRISAIMDIYDALTTKRSYKKAMTPFEALSLISKNESDFDKHVFGTFVQLISKQEL